MAITVEILTVLRNFYSTARCAQNQRLSHKTHAPDCETAQIRSGQFRSGPELGPPRRELGLQPLNDR